MVVSLKTDLRFPIPGQQGHGGRIIHQLDDSCFTVATKTGDLYTFNPDFTQSCKNIVSSPEPYFAPPPKRSENMTLLYTIFSLRTASRAQPYFKASILRTRANFLIGNNGLSQFKLWTLNKIASASGCFSNSSITNSWYPVSYTHLTLPTILLV